MAALVRSVTFGEDLVVSVGIGGISFVISNGIIVGEGTDGSIEDDTSSVICTGCCCWWWWSMDGSGATIASNFVKADEALANMFDHMMEFVEEY